MTRAREPKWIGLFPYTQSAAERKNAGQNEPARRSSDAMLQGLQQAFAFLELSA